MAAVKTLHSNLNKKWDERTLFPYNPFWTQFGSLASISTRQRISFPCRDEPPVSLTLVCPRDTSVGFLMGRHRPCSDAGLLLSINAWPSAADAPAREMCGSVSSTPSPKHYDALKCLMIRPWGLYPSTTNVAICQWCKNCQFANGPKAPWEGEATKICGGKCI